MTSAHDRTSLPNRPPLRLVPDAEPFDLAGRIQQALDTDPFGAYGLNRLVDRCGAVEVLAMITDFPPTSRSSGGTEPATNRDVVAVIDATALRFLDDEYRSIIFELVTLASTHSTNPLERRTTTRRLGAALTWIALTGNGKIGRSGTWQAADIWFWFGVGNCAPLARAIADDLGMLRDPEASAARYPHNDIVLGDAALLHSDARASIAAQRDIALKIVDQNEQRRRAARPIADAGNGQIRISAQSLQVLMAFRVTDEGRDHLVMTFGDEANDPDQAIALSIPDARLLHQRLSEALDGPSRT